MWFRSEGLRFKLGYLNSMLTGSVESGDSLGGCEDRSDLRSFGRTLGEECLIVNSAQGHGGDLIHLHRRGESGGFFKAQNSTVNGKLQRNCLGTSPIRCNNKNPGSLGLPMLSEN